MPIDYSQNISYNPATYAQPNQINNQADIWSFGAQNQPRQQLTKATRSFAGQGGTFTQAMPENAGGIDWRTGQRISAPTGLGGEWSNSAGVRMSDLPGYLQMKEQQRQGADFSGYQNQLQGLMNDPSKIQQTPGYQFAVDQGNQAINRSAAAKGQLNSGGVLAELAKYGQGMANQEYGNQINRLSGLMQNAQNFGLQSGYYQPEQYTPNLGIKPGSGGVSSSGGITTRTIQQPQQLQQSNPMNDMSNQQDWINANFPPQENDQQRANRIYAQLHPGG